MPPSSPRRVETSAVTLARMEGKLDQIGDRLNAYDDRLGAVERDTADLVLKVQRLGDQANARDDTVAATASALKDADDARRLQDNQTWTPTSRMLTTISVLVTVVAVVFAFAR